MRKRRYSTGLAVVAACLFYVAVPDIAAAPQRSAVARAPARGQVRVQTRPGARFRTLPRGHTAVVVKGVSYYYQAGVFYRNAGHDYVVVRAPIGARVRILPVGVVRLTIGSRPYFFVNDIYFVLDDQSRDYVVVEPPAEAPSALAEAQGALAQDVYAYPRDGQSEDEVRLDRYECHVWAADQSGFDPSLPNQSPGGGAAYNRAVSACLEGRDYVVK